jgi:hypothetical protein
MIDIQQFDSATQMAISTQNSSERSRAMHFLNSILSMTETKQTLILSTHILLHSNSIWSKVYVLDVLDKVVASHWMVQEEKVELAKFVLQQLNVQPVQVHNALACLLSKCCTLGWLENDTFKDIADQLISGRQTLQLICLSQLTRDMDTQPRKVAISFRDSHLHKIFNAAQSSLASLIHSPDEKHMQITLLTLKTCLQFDFIGTNSDDDSTGSIQIPGAWKSNITNPDFLSNLFTAHHSLPPGPLTANCMEVIGLVSSARRSLFAEDERMLFLNSLINKQIALLQSRRNFDSETLHEFARALARMKTVYQLTELAQVQNFLLWLELISNLTAESIPAKHVSGNTVQYLVTFWSRILTPSSHLTDNLLAKMEKIARLLVETYIACVMNGLRTDEEEDEMQVSHLLEPLASIARFNYRECVQVLLKWWGSIQQGEQKMSWYVLLCGAFVAARVPYSSGDEEDDLDGQVASRIIWLMKNHTSLDLEMSIIQYWIMFRKTFVGDQAQRASRVWAPLSEKWGLSDVTSLLNFLITHIAHNFEKYIYPQVICWSVRWLNDVSTGYSSVKMVRKLDPTCHLMSRHASFPFLTRVGSLEERRNRGMYYQSLAKLLFSSDEVDESEFLEFVKPWTNMLKDAESISTDGFSLENVQRTLEGFFRDITGFLSGVTAKKYFVLFFKWIRPHFPLFVRIVKANFESKVAVGVLRFYIELMQNKSQRYNFDGTSVYGVLLFREGSNIVCAYGPSMYTLPDRLKGFSLMCQVVKWGLAGKYCNFGLMRLYKDPALDHALATLFKVQLSLPVKEVLQVPKVAKAYLEFWSVLSSEQLFELEGLNPEVLKHVFMTCYLGIESTDNVVVAESCSILDSIATFLCKGQTHFLQGLDVGHLSLCMAQLLMIVIMSDSPNQWTLSRPLLSLIVLCPEDFQQLSHRLVSVQIPQQQELMKRALETLWNGMDRKLNPKNRDLFTQNISSVRKMLSSEEMTRVTLVPAVTS